MLYADSSNAGTCCMLRVALLVPVWLSRLTSRSAISGVSIRGWLAAVPRCFSFEMAHMPKTSCLTFVFRQKVKGHVKIILFYFCASHRVGPTVVPCFLKGSLVIHFSFYPFMFPLTSTCMEDCCLLSIDWRVVSRNFSWQKREYTCIFNSFRKNCICIQSELWTV